MRPSGRQADELRKINFEIGVSKHAEGSCLVKFGDTQKKPIFTLLTHHLSCLGAFTTSLKT